MGVVVAPGSSGVSLGGRNAWFVSLVALLVLIVAIVALYWGTAAAMVAIWIQSETFTHAFLVPPISLWLVWRMRDELAPLEPRPAPWVLLPMAGAAALWLAADLVQVNAAAQFALVAMIVLAVPAVLGVAVARRILFPLGFLFFCVPIGAFLIPVMMQYTADFTVLGLRLTGVPVHQEGMHLVVPTGNWSVIEECSGVRYLIASVMVGSLFAYLNFRTTWRRWAFVGVAIVVPVLANWVRAYITVLVGHLSNNTYLVGADHIVFGWTLFGAIVGVMFLVGSRWTEPDLPPAPAVAAAPASSVSRPSLLVLVLGAAAALVAPHLVIALLDSTRDTSIPKLVMPERWQGGWQVSDLPVTTWAPQYDAPSARSVAGAGRDGVRVGVHVLYYRNQDYSRKLISSQNALVRTSNLQWHRVASGWSELELAGGGRQRTISAELAPTASSDTGRVARIVVRQLYWVDGRFTSSDVLAKIYGVLGRLAGHGDDAATVIAYASMDERGEVPSRLESFLAANLDTLQQALVAASRPEAGTLISKPGEK